MKLLLLLLILFFCSCNSNQSKIIENAINVDFIDEELDISSITDNYKVTLLKAPTDDAFFHEKEDFIFQCRNLIFGK